MWKFVVGGLVGLLPKAWKLFRVLSLNPLVMKLGMFLGFNVVIGVIVGLVWGRFDLFTPLQILPQLFASFTQITDPGFLWAIDYWQLPQLRPPSKR